MEPVQIQEFEKQYEEQVIDLIVGIQRGEFNIPITAADQPDLKIVDTFYQKGKGNFWVALHEGSVVGTIGIIDIGNDEVALRKMFVNASFRGKDKAVGQLLLDTVFDWCKQQHIKAIHLGTVAPLQAAIRFYERNGFTRVAKEQLPASFPAMALDHIFFTYLF